jgi:hypothetical protein
VIRRTIATLAQKKGTPKDIQGLLRHSRLATTTDVLHAGDSRKREGDGGSDQQRTAIEVRKRRTFLKFPANLAKRQEVDPLSC